MRDLVIVGAGGHGRETLDIVEAINAVQPTWNMVGFIDDRYDTPGADPDELLARRDAALCGSLESAASFNADYVIAIGLSSVRQQVHARLAADGPAPMTGATLIHPEATVASDNRVGQGVLLAAGARVTTNVTLGDHVHLNVNAVVSHDSVIGDFATLSPGVLVNGNVTIEPGVFLGTGAIVTPGVTIGAGATIGAGSVVVNDIPPGVTVKGVPGRW